MPFLGRFVVIALTPSGLGFALRNLYFIVTSVNLEPSSITDVWSAPLNFSTFFLLVSKMFSKVVWIFIKKKNDEVSLRISNLRVRDEKAVFDGFAEIGRM